MKEEPMSTDRLTRRGFLGTGAVAGAGLLWGSSLGGCSLVQAKDGHEGLHAGSESQAKNVIFLVADGMNTGTWSLADYYLQHQNGSKNLGNRRTEWVHLYAERLVNRALMETCSANSLVTDSAAAGSAWACGQRVNNGSLNYSPEGQPLTPLHDLVQKSGRATGLVTTTRMSHATPASFATSVPQRGMEDAIAAQYLDKGVEVLLGGGSRHFAAESRADGEDLFGKFRKAGYEVIGKRDELLSVTEVPDRLLGTFWGTHLPYTIDRNHREEVARQVPTLAEMMRAALKVLDSKPNGFLLQVEGGRVDHAGHGNDPGAIVHDQLAFDECIAVALEYTRDHPDTLVVVTTDHGCGGCQLNGMGASYLDTDKTFFNGIDALSSSFEYLRNQFGVLSRGEFKDLTEASIQLVLTEDQLDVLDGLKSTNYGVSTQLRKWYDPIQRTGVNFTSTNHTGEFVELSAWGPGSGNFNSFVTNTDVNAVVRRVLGLS
ncbi:MAG: hypothetical protein CBC13_11815 [Planctomycetia bacterium TMED53]|nr:MAG: hypothetical protein CBC13_11815 [Planctomycetia bacterium TMED53]